jgi:DNA polymerase-3 subunit epsilon
MSWYQQALIAFDLETTGLDLEQDRIITAAVSRVGQDISPEHRSWQLNPGIPISAEAQALHGISTADSQNFQPAASGISELLDYLQALLSAGEPLVIFNARFDLTILDREARRYQLLPLQERVDPLLVIDPLVIDRAVDPWRPGSRRLPAVAQAYGLDAPEEHHNANDDALVSARLAWKIGRRYDQYLDVSLGTLHKQQIVWAASQAQGLADYFRRQGQAQEVRPEWPIIPQEPEIIIGSPAEPVLSSTGE